MKLTSFGFVDLAETFLKNALSSAPLNGGSWGFQRSVNLSERTGSLRVVLTNSSGVATTKASIQARQTGTSKDFSIQGWTELPDQDKREMFVLKESNPVRVQDEVFEIVDRLIAEIPERDQSVAFERPAPPPPKSTFEPLIPEIQNAPAEPQAESTESNQVLVDSLLTPDNFIEPTSSTSTDAPHEEAPAAEKKTPKAKATKAKKQ
jgi:hypothetical protein